MLRMSENINSDHFPMLLHPSFYFSTRPSAHSPLALLFLYLIFRSFTPSLSIPLLLHYLSFSPLLPPSGCLICLHTFG